jgi:hypothetical protein
MKQMKFFQWVIVGLIIASTVGCSKSSSPSNNSGSDTTGSGGTGGSGGSGTGAGLLTKEVVVLQASGVTVDSTVIQLTYTGTKISTETETSTASYSGGNSTTNLSYTYTYSGNLPTSLAGTMSESINIGSTNYTSGATTNVKFYATGNQITSFVQSATTTGTAQPTTQENANDSAIIAYDASGNVTSYDIYLLPSGQTAYIPWTQETFTYANGNISGTVLEEYVVGILTNTVTSAYTYNSKAPASPYFDIPGVPIPEANDVTTLSQVTTGGVTGTTTYTYTTTYNSSSQPTSSSVAVVTTPAQTVNITSETITYTYQ